MKPLLLLYAISTALGISLSHVLKRQAVECTFGEAMESQSECTSNIILDPRNYEEVIREPFLSALCSKRVEYTGCVERFAQGCANKDAVINYLLSSVAHCDGTDLQGYLNDSLTETSTLVEPFCLSTTGLDSPKAYENCSVYAEEQTNSGFNQNLTTSAGVEQLVNTWIPAVRACIRGKIEPKFEIPEIDAPHYSSCTATTPRLVYNKVVTEIPFFPLFLGFYSEAF